MRFVRGAAPPHESAGTTPSSPAQEISSFLAGGAGADPDRPEPQRRTPRLRRAPASGHAARPLAMHLRRPHGAAFAPRRRDRRAPSRALPGSPARADKPARAPPAPTPPTPPRNPPAAALDRAPRPRPGNPYPCGLSRNRRPGHQRKRPQGPDTESAAWAISGGSLPNRAPGAGPPSSGGGYRTPGFA